MYKIENRPAPPQGYHTPSQARAYYGKYSRTGITIHWWNTPDKAGSHDGTVNYILGKARAGSTPTVNYVASNSKITIIVHPDNVAWASNNGNPTTISIEFDPRLNAEGYKKAGWLINELEERYGRTLKLYPHNHWIATQCPGSLDLNRMRAEANKWKSGAYDMYKNKSAKQWYNEVVNRDKKVKSLSNQIKDLKNKLSSANTKIVDLSKNPSKATLDDAKAEIVQCQADAENLLLQIEAKDKALAEAEKVEHAVPQNEPEVKAPWYIKLLANLTKLFKKST